MVQRWQRLGRIFSPEPVGPWGVSHASYPTALPIYDCIIRIYFSMRDADNRAHLASADFSVTPQGAKRVSEVRGPLLSPGPRGAFDADGVTVTSLVRTDDNVFAYYLGWNKGVSVPFTNFIGLAVGDREGHSFKRPFRAPVVGRSEYNPITIAYPWVLRDGQKWRMWFSSCLGWGAGPREHPSVINAAESTDGLSWNERTRTAVPLAGARDPSEVALGRPTVIRGQDGYSMWYSRLRPNYCLGYAWSRDGEDWERYDQELQFDGEVGEWERNEQTYPCVFDHGGHRYMLYNGDGYGKSGFGLAVLQ
jgi:hypothetical protein